MTDPTGVRRDHDCGGDVAAYALGALDETELVAFRRHLESCAVCRDELAAFAQVVDTLPMSVPAYRAPSSLRKSVLRAVEGEPEEARPRPARRRLTVARPAFAFGAVAALAVAAIVVVLALGTSSSPSTRVIDASVVGQGSAQLHVTRDRGKLVVHRFPAPAGGHVYELWLQRGKKGAPLPRGLFNVDARGNATVSVPGSLRGGSHVLVTSEPAGGTLKPTSAPVISAALE